MNSISIIIPIINEANSIEKLLHYLLENSCNDYVKELIIVDGGSHDNSQEMVTKIFKKISHNQIKCYLISSLKGRAKQMNTGSNIATGSILYFLHADSFPPPKFDNLIINKVNKGHLAGCFRLQFQHSHWWLRLASWLTQFNWRACRGGDQSQFITKNLFEDIGGFDENYMIYEDNILINQLYKRNQFTVINEKLITSARRYEKHGIWKLQYHFWMIYIKKWLGNSPNDLYTYYKKYIN